MPSFNVGRALESGYEPAEVLRYLAGKGVTDERYAGLKDEEKIRRLLADTGGKVMLPYSYATQQMPPADIEKLYSQEQGITPELGLPMSLTDMVMEPAMSFLEEADVAKYVLPLSLLGMVRYKKPGVSATARETAEKYHRRPIRNTLRDLAAPTGEYTMQACGPGRAGCHDLPEINPADFHERGGQDIVVWDKQYTVKGDHPDALDYAIGQLDLDVESVQTPRRLLGPDEYETLRRRLANRK